MKNSYEQNGVVFSCATAKTGEPVEIVYTGLLKNSGASEVSAHIGYNEAWDDMETIPMEYKEDAFVASITLKHAGNLNCAFVDPMGNWDNNSGENYTLEVKKAAAKRAAAKKATDAGAQEDTEKAKAEASATKTATKTTTKTTARKTTATKKAADAKTEKAEPVKKAPATRKRTTKATESTEAK